MASAQPAGVRFAAQNQEIAPDHSLEDIQMSNERDGDDSNPNSEQDIAQLKSTLQNNIQNSRMQHHAFEPVSLPGSMPASRVRISNTHFTSRVLTFYSGPFRRCHSLWHCNTEQETHARWLDRSISQTFSSHHCRPLASTHSGRHQEP